MKTIIKILTQFSCNKEIGFLYSHSGNEYYRPGNIQILVLPNEDLESDSLEILGRFINEYSIDSCDILIMQEDPLIQEKLQFLINFIEEHETIKKLEIKSVVEIQTPVLYLNDILYQKETEDVLYTGLKLNLLFNKSYTSLDLSKLPVQIRELSKLNVRRLSLPVYDHSTLDSLIRNDFLEHLDMHINNYEHKDLTIKNNNIYDLTISTNESFKNLAHITSYFPNLDYFTVTKI